MIKKYLIERRSWIFLFLSVQSLIIFIAFLDSTIPIMPILYITFLSIIIFIIFLTIRYNKETSFFKSLVEWENSLDLTGLSKANSPFEKIIEESFTNQTERQKEIASQNVIALEQEKDELLSWIHEVKTPLTAMHLIIERLDDDKIKAQLTYEWLRIHLLLDQQLHQKRLPFMENDLYVERTDLKVLVFNEIRTLQSWCLQKGIGFDIHLDVLEVTSDAKWLSFIIRQLFTNAVKYSEASDIKIRSFEQDGHAKLEIKDFGRGIDPKDMPRIFDKGFTSTTKHHDHAATGMGLYLTKKIAQPLLIQIEVLSNPGEGTTFTLTFPQVNEFVHISGM